MPYYLRSFCLAKIPALSELVEMTATDLDVIHAGGRKQEYRLVSAIVAHRHVRQGGVHSTGLWVDDHGRIRKTVAIRWGDADVRRLFTNPSKRPLAAQTLTRIARGARRAFGHASERQ